MTVDLGPAAQPRRIPTQEERMTAPDRIRLTGRCHTADPDTCERILHAALAAGDMRGVEAALLVMASQDPRRAQQLVDTIQAALTLADHDTAPGGRDE